jgi:hypothetical protein
MARCLKADQARHLEGAKDCANSESRIDISALHSLSGTLTKTQHLHTMSHSQIHSTYTRYTAGGISWAAKPVHTIPTARHTNPCRDDDLCCGQVTPVPKNRLLYRGLGGMSVPAAFWPGAEDGFRGGVELGFMSTTSKRDVATYYSGSGAAQAGTVFEIQAGRVDIGASLSWLSQYPGVRRLMSVRRGASCQHGTAVTRGTIRLALLAVDGFIMATSRRGCHDKSVRKRGSASKWATFSIRVGYVNQHPSGLSLLHQHPSGLCSLHSLADVVLVYRRSDGRRRLLASP